MVHIASYVSEFKKDGHAQRCLSRREALSALAAAAAAELTGAARECGSAYPAGLVIRSGVRWMYRELRSTLGHDMFAPLAMICSYYRNGLLLLLLLQVIPDRR